MRVLCDNDACLYNKNRDCQKEIIWIEDGECIDFCDYTGLNPEYQDVFYCHIKDPETQEHYKVKRIGKKFKLYNHVFYSCDDDRYGFSDMWFTEEITGYGIPGKYFDPSLPEEKRLQIVNAMEKMINDAVPVKDLPEKKEDNK